MSAVQRALSITQLLAMTSIQMDEKESNSTLRLVFVVGQINKSLLIALIDISFGWNSLHYNFYFEIISTRWQKETSPTVCHPVLVHARLSRKNISIQSKDTRPVSGLEDSHPPPHRLYGKLKPRDLDSQIFLRFRWFLIFKIFFGVLIGSLRQSAYQLTVLKPKLEKSQQTNRAREISSD